MDFLEKKSMGNIYTPTPPTAHSHPTTHIPPTPTPKYPPLVNVKNNLYIRLATNYANRKEKDFYLKKIHWNTWG